MRRTHRQIRRPRRMTFGLAAALLPLLLLATLVGAQAPAPLLPAARPTQAGATIYLPLINRPGAPAPVGSPVIDSFQLSPSAGPMAAEVELHWRASGATSLMIEPGVGDVRGAASASVYPIATTTYTLTATNAKGSTSATVTYTVNAMPVPNPLTVAARPDAGRAISASVGAAGGTVEAIGTDGTRYTFVVPPEALLYTEVITLTPVAAIDGMPFAAAGVRAVSIAPEGLEFIEPATLLITPPAAPAAPRTVGFAFEGAGTEFHLRTAQSPDGAALVQAAGASSLSVVTARSYGAADVGDDNDLLAPLVRNPPSDPADSAEHVYNAALDEAQNATLRRAQLLVHLQDDFLVFTGTQLTLASRNPEGPAPFDLESAVRSYISWRARVRAARLEEQLRPQISEANLLLGEALRKAGALASERCNAPQPAQGFALQRYMGYAKRFGLANTRAALEERLKKCWVFDLSFQSRMDQQFEEISAVYELGARLNLRYGQSGRIIGSAPLSWKHFDVTIGDDCTLVTSNQDSIFSADGGELGLLLEPVSRTSSSVRLSLSYEVGQPTANWTVTCPKQPPVPFSSPLWWVMYGETHRDERVGDGYTARAAAVLSSFPGWVYDNTFGGELVEHTEITLKHTPEP